MLGPVITLILTAGPMARLDYRVAPGLEGCPDEQWVRSAVSARLGRDPFDAAGENAVSVQLARSTGAALVATVEVVRPDGRVGRRTLDSPTGDCLELASAMELAIALALDPSARKAAPSVDAGAPAPLPVDAGVPLPPVVEPPVTVAAPTPPPPSSVSPFVGASVLLTAGALPGVSGGLLVGGGVKVANFRISVEGRLHLPTRVLVGSSATSTFLALGAVVPCLDVGRVSACLAAAAGPFQFDDGFERATTVMAHVGPRVGVRVEPSKLMSVLP